MILLMTRISRQILLSKFSLKRNTILLEKTPEANFPKSQSPSISSIYRAISSKLCTLGELLDSGKPNVLLVKQTAANSISRRFIAFVDRLAVTCIHVCSQILVKLEIAEKPQHFSQNQTTERPSTSISTNQPPLTTSLLS